MTRGSPPGSDPSEPAAAGALSAAQIRSHALGREPTLGTHRLICLDGPAGSGKTTLAMDLARHADTRVVHLDDLYPGWDGLRQVAGIVEPMLRDLADGRTARYRRYDWIAAAPAEQVEVEPTPLLVLDGVGAGSRAWADLITTLVWVEAPAALRLTRGLDRDGRHLAAEWTEWMQTERTFLAQENLYARADLYSTNR